MLAAQDITNIKETINHIDEVHENKRDFLVPMTRLQGTVTGLGEVGLAFEAGPKHEEFVLTEHAESQLATKLNIPIRYWKLIKEQDPDLLYENLVRRLDHPRFAGSTAMVRTLQGNARAVLSDRYQTIDNHDLLEVLIESLQLMKDENDWYFQKFQVSETRMYIKLLSKRLTADVKLDDTVQAGIVISNSEVGNGAVTIEPLLFRLVCLNGMIVNDLASRRAHIGRRQELEQATTAVLSDRTRSLMDASYLSTVKDVISSFAQPDTFNTLVQQCRNSAELTISRDPLDTVVEVSKREKLNEAEHKSLLTNYLESQDRTAWGLANAITATAREHPDADRTIELERIGSRYLDPRFLLN